VTVSRLRFIDPNDPDSLVLQDAAGCLREHGLVAFPTETFYGLGANAMDRESVRRVFEVKGRSESKPLLVLVDSVTMAESLASEVSNAARGLMNRYWPGPLTLVFRAVPGIPSELTAGTGTIGIRMPGHRVALELVRVFGLPITAPSANPSGEPPPTTAQAVLEKLTGSVDLILDGGPTAGGLPSTVLDVSVSPPRLLRQGAVTIS
jgi:L-threonylcarbamoyladenylate synthase